MLCTVKCFTVAEKRKAAGEGEMRKRAKERGVGRPKEEHKMVTQKGVRCFGDTELTENSNRFAEITVSQAL